MTPYEKYCNSMKELGFKPTMTETQLHEAWGIKREDEHIPILVRPKKNDRLVAPSLEVHEKKPVEKKPVERKLCKQLDKRARKTDRIMSPRISRILMNEEELQKHKNQILKNWQIRNKESIKLKRTIEDHEAELQRRREYYQANKEKILIKNKKWKQNNKEKVKITQHKADKKRGRYKNEE